MKKNERENEKKAFVYIVECSDGSLYTGWTNDVAKRIKKHNAGTGAKYTRSRLPVKLIYCEELANKSEALKKEYEIKQMPRKDKLKYIEEKNK